MTQKQRPVLHYAVTPQAYNMILDVLAQLPYGQVAPVLENLSKGTAPVYPPAAVPNNGEIVDNPGGSGPEGDDDDKPAARAENLIL